MAMPADSSISTNRHAADASSDGGLQGTDLFRLVALRNPEPASADVLRIMVEDISFDFERSNLEVATAPSRWAIVSRDTESGDDDDDEPGRALSLHDFDSFLAAGGDVRTPSEIDRWVRDTTGDQVKDLVRRTDFLQQRRQAHAGLVAVLEPDASVGTALASSQLPLVRDVLLRAVRMLSLLELIADGRVADSDVVRAVLRTVPVVLPARLARPADNLLRPPFIGDLKVVRTGPLRYEPGAIAHIENVMGREHREREHRVLEQLETTTTLTTERIRETEEELGTNSQTLLHQETSSAVSEATQMEAGIQVSASYGPSVEVDLDARVARQGTREEAAAAAATYSNEITRRARERIIERQHAVRMTRRLVETEETNKHGFDNKESGQHLVGVYRWVDSVQDCWIENYGQRLLLDFLVPEPAAFLRWATEQSRKQVQIPEEPAAPTAPGEERPLTPADIQPDNYLSLVGEWSASNVPPPPAPSVEIAVTFRGESHAEDVYVFADSSTLKVPVGYRATSWRAFCTTWGDPDPGGVAWLIGVGAAGGIEEGDRAVLKKIHEGTLSAEEGSVVPVVMLARDALQLAAAVRVHCELTSSGLAKWQQQVFDAVMGAYRRMHEDWQVEKARVTAEALGDDTAAYDGSSNPLANRETERREIRRGVLHLLLGGPLDEGVFAQDAVVHDTVAPYEPPRLDLDVVAQERDTLVFLEQAFDWNNMSWVLYPYYWSAKELWQRDMVRNSPDPQHAAFLSAGAARVVVPVRRGFEAAVNLFVATGVIWSGGQVPTAGSPTFVAIADEIAGSMGTGMLPPSNRVDLDPVRLPTTLIWLQDTPDLNPPAFR